MFSSTTSNRGLRNLRKFSIPEAVSNIHIRLSGGPTPQAEDLASNNTLTEAGAADGDTEETTCTDRWQAAAADVVKRMWAIFRESCIFIAACRHGMIWLIVDMVNSGELYVGYFLAITSHTLDLVRNTPWLLLTPCSGSLEIIWASDMTLAVHFRQPSQRAPSAMPPNDRTFAFAFQPSTDMPITVLASSSITPCTWLALGLKIWKPANAFFQFQMPLLA